MIVHDNMTRAEMVQELLIKGQTSNASYNDWVVSLLSSIAMSLAIIADKMSEEVQNADK